MLCPDGSTCMSIYAKSYHMPFRVPGEVFKGVLAEPYMNCDVGGIGYRRGKGKQIDSRINL